MSRLSPNALALLAALTLVWGTNWPLFRIALSEISVLTFRTVVLATATLVLFVILKLRGESFAVPKDTDSLAEVSRSLAVLVGREGRRRLVEGIAELLNEKKLPLIESFRDESTEDVRIVIEPKSRTVDGLSW